MQAVKIYIHVYNNIYNKDLTRCRYILVKVITERIFRGFEPKSDGLSANIRVL